MAGPTLLSTGGVIDPYATLQNAVSNVGQIYQNYEESARKNAEFQAQEQERNRVRSMRKFAADYDARVGEDYRGINASMRPLVEQSEAQARKQWQAANPNVSADQAAAFDDQLRTARRSLVSAEDVATTVTNDYRKSGFSPEEAEAYGRQAAAGYAPRGAALSRAQAEADARNEAADKMSQRLLDLYKVQASSDDSRIRALDDLDGNSRSGTGAGRTGASGGGSGSLAEPDKLMNLEEYLKKAIGGDSRQAMSSFEQGLAAYNEKAKAAGGKPLSYEQGQAVAATNLSRGGMLTNNKALYKDSADFAALLTAQYGPADGAPTTGANGGVGGPSAERLALINNMRTSISSAERQAILNPSRTVVNPEQVIRQQVASAYASLFPQAAQENRAAATQPNASPASAPSRINAAVGAAARYRPTPAAPLAEGQTRGTGFTSNNPSTQGTPAGVPSNPVSQTNAQPVTPARELAEQIAAYERNGTDGSVDLPRVLQTLQARNPEMYQAVIRERNAIGQENAQYDKLSKELAALETRSDVARKRLASQDPNSLSTDRPLTGKRPLFDASNPYRAGGVSTPVESDSPYQQYLNEQTQLDGWEQQIQQLRSRKQAMESTNQPKDFSRLKSILNR